MALFDRKKILELEDQIDDLVVTNSKLLEDVANYKKTISSFVGVKTAYEAEKAKLMKNHASEVSQLKQQMETEKKSIARRVNAELSSIGVSRFFAEEISVENVQHSAESIVTQFTSMSESPLKHEFFKQNEKVLSAYLKAQKQ